MANKNNPVTKTVVVNFELIASIVPTCLRKDYYVITGFDFEGWVGLEKYPDIADLFCQVVGAVKIC